MDLRLPPRISSTDFQRAAEAFSDVVGADWVMVYDEDRETYSDVYALGLAARGFRHLGETPAKRPRGHLFGWTMVSRGSA